MLEMRPVCENGGKDLPNDRAEAMIYTFECTLCRNCVEHTLENVCPNCGGGFQLRPTRPRGLLSKYPVETKPLVKPVDPKKLAELKQRPIAIPPRQR
ncbi:MAG: DUF1272 domain-containing protein [Bacteroidota bacterium]